MEISTVKALTRMYYTLGSMENNLGSLEDASEKREIRAYINGLKYAIACIEEAQDNGL